MMAIQIQPELVTDLEVGAMLHVSRRKVHSMRSAGQLPAEIRIGRSLRWRASDIREWIRQGCPNREVFEREAVAAQ